MSIAFDGPNRIIQFGGGQTAFAAQDIYEDWKNWILAGNAQYPPAFRSIGGDPLGGGTFAGSYFFLNNTEGWRIRPEAVDHELVVNGNLFGDNPALAVFLPTVGDFQVMIRLNTSSLTQQVAAGSGLSVEQSTMLSELWKRLGLDPANPLVSTPSAITAGAGVNIAVTGDGVTSSTATRQV